ETHLLTQNISLAVQRPSRAPARTRRVTDPFARSLVRSVSQRIGRSVRSVIFLIGGPSHECSERRRFVPSRAQSRHVGSRGRSLAAQRAAAATAPRFRLSGTCPSGCQGRVVWSAALAPAGIQAQRPGAGGDEEQPDETE